MKREAFHILQSIHRTIQGHCHESPRRCWEYLVEMLAHATGWRTETQESKALWDPMQNESRWAEFLEAWLDEVDIAKKNRFAFSEPIGELLEVVEGTNQALDQYFTPMQVVRAMNEINFSDIEVPENGYLQGLDPCCGTGRFMLDALVFNEKLIMANVDMDLWLLRAAKLNARLLGRWTTLHEPFLCWDATLAGRARFIWGDSLIVDLNFPLNWSLSWYWTPQHWRDDLKIEGFPGTLNQWIDAGRPKKVRPGTPGDLQFDYSMRDPVTHQTEPRSEHGRRPSRKKLGRGQDSQQAQR
jgi:hypothetical protein